MFGFEKSDNLKNFEKVVNGIGEDEMPITSISVYNCWKLFNVKYKSVQNWQTSQDDQIEWFTFLDDLAKKQLKEEMNGDLPFGTTSGVYLTIFFFKAIALNEDAKNINTMSDYMEEFNKIGYDISQAK